MNKLPPELDNTLKEMFNELKGARKEILPSKYWKSLNERNIYQLQQDGYKNFKRTIATNYFTWIRSFSQSDFLMKNLPPQTVALCAVKAAAIAKKPFLMREEPVQYPKLMRSFVLAYRHYSSYFLTYMLWEYVKRNDPNKLLEKICEPSEGNPPEIYLRKKLISQDLANSVLEYNSIREFMKEEPRVIMELGAGYGRTAYVFLSFLSKTKYIIVDIPPALYIAQRYLSNQFKNRKIFKFRPFENFQKIKNEFEEAEIVFLLPNQLELLPSKSVNLFINISSLHEMRPDQIKYYFSEIDRLTKGYFYFKQWKNTTVPVENVIISEKTYPVKKNWNKIYWRDCKVHTLFFEAIYEIK